MKGGQLPSRKNQEAQKVMRDKLTDITHVLLLGTVRLSLAVSSMLAATVKTVCVDIDPWAVERVIAHRPYQSIGLVTDIEPFLRGLADCIEELDRASGAKKK